MIYLYNLSNIKTIKSILEKHGFKFTKSLGQNFIINPSVCPKMAEFCCENEKSGILEIGPGIGVLTIELAKRFKKVVSVEIDTNLIPILSETTADFENIKIINKDILKVDLNQLYKTEFLNCEEIAVCANLPYYITSEIVMYLLENNPGFKSLTFMVQKEAAERICADFGTRESGAISVAIRYYGKPRVLFNVSRGSFIPAPKVDSSVIKININSDISSKIKNKEKFFQIIKATYSKRRKNILNSLSMHFKISKEEILKILNTANVDPHSRPEQLKLEDFINISDFI